MQLTQSESVNALIQQLDKRIRTLIPGVKSIDRPGYRSTSYFLQSGMQNEVCYILCYDQKANLGFAHGVTLLPRYPLLQGNGKTHRHLLLTPAIFEPSFPLIDLLLDAFTTL
jgi:hypothetical protein